MKRLVTASFLLAGVFSGPLSADDTAAFQAALDGGLLLIPDPGTYEVNDLDVGDKTLIVAHPRARIEGTDTVFKTSNKIVKDVHIYGGIWSAPVVWRHSGDLALADCSFNNMQFSGTGGGSGMRVDTAVGLKFNHVEFADFYYGVWLGDSGSSTSVANVNRFNDVRMRRVHVGILVNPGKAARGNFIDTGWFEDLEDSPGIGAKLYSPIEQGNVIGGVTYFEDVTDPYDGNWTVLDTVVEN